MGDLTKNLSRHEFKCKCGKCPAESADFELVNAIQKAADWAAGVYNKNVPVIITSGHRCEEHNRKVGGASNSMHIRGIAADFYLKDVPIHQLFGVLQAMAGEHRWGIGRYPTWVHLDMRAEPARWYE